MRVDLRPVVLLRCRSLFGELSWLRSSFCLVVCCLRVCCREIRFCFATAASDCPRSGDLIVAPRGCVGSLTDGAVCCMDICVGVCWNVWFSVAGCHRLLMLVQVAASLLPMLSSMLLAVTSCLVLPGVVASLSSWRKCRCSWCRLRCSSQVEVGKG